MSLTLSVTLTCILAILPVANSLFKLIPDTSLTPQNLTNPSKIVLDDSGSKFFIYNNESSFRIYDTNGTMQCESFFDSQISRVIWPSNYHPMVVIFPGMQLYKLSENDCTVIQNYTFATNALELTFAWRDGIPVLAVTMQLFIQEYNANTFTKLRTINSNIVVFKIANALYSQDSLTLYASEITMFGSRRVQVFNTQAGGTIGNISLNNSINGMSLMKDGKNIVLFETNLLDFETNVYGIYANGTSSYLFGRSNVRKMLGLWTANVVVNFKANSMTFEVIKVDNKSSIQNLTYSTNPSLTTMIDFDLQNDTIAILDSYGVVTIGSYQPDKQPDPEPQPQPEKEKGGMEVWMFGAIGGGALLLIIGLLVICRKRLKQLKCFQKCFKGQQQDTETQQDSVITSEVKKPQRKQSQQSQKHINKPNIDPNPLLQDQISYEQRKAQLQRQQRLWKQYQQQKLREQVQKQLLMQKLKKEQKEREEQERLAERKRLRQELQELEETRKQKQRQEWERRNRVQGDEYHQQQGSQNNPNNVIKNNDHNQRKDQFNHNSQYNKDQMFPQYDHNNQFNQFNNSNQLNNNNHDNSHLKKGPQHQKPQYMWPNYSNLPNYQHQPYDFNKPPQYNNFNNVPSSIPSNSRNPSASSFSNGNLSHYDLSNNSSHMNIPNQPQYNPPQYPSYPKPPSSSSFSHNILPTQQHDLSYPSQQIPLVQEEQSLTGYEDYSQRVNLQNQSRFNSKKQSKPLPEFSKPLTQKPEIDDLVYQRNNLFNNKNGQKFSENPNISEPQQKTLSESHMVIDKNNKIQSNNQDV